MAGNNYVGQGSQSAANLISMNQAEQQYFAELVNSKGILNGTSIFAAMSLTGGVKDVNSRLQYHFEENFTWVNGEVEAITVAPGGAGNPITIRLTNASHDQTGEANFTERDMVFTSNRGANNYNATGFIATAPTTTVDANLVTITPNDPTVNYSVGGNFEIRVGDTIAVYANSNPEGSNSRTSRRYQQERYQVQFQTIRETYNTTGDAIPQAHWIDVGSNRYEVDYEKAQNRINFLRSLDGVILQQEPNTNPLTTAASGTTTTGIIPSIRAAGGYTSGPAGAFTTSYFQGVTRALNAKGAPFEQTLMYGFNFGQKWANYLQNFPNGALIFSGKPGSEAGYNILYMLDGVTIDSYRFTGTLMGRWSHPGLEGPMGYSDEALMMSMAKRWDVTGDQATAMSQARVLTMAGNGIRRMNLNWEHGGMANANKTGYDGLYQEWLATIAVQIFGVDQMTYFFKP